MKTSPSPGVPCGLALPVFERRRFVSVAAAAVCAALAGGCATVAAVPVAVSRGRVRLDLSTHLALQNPGGYLKVLPEGRDVPIYVLRDGGGWSALSPVCTHLGCVVEVEGAALVCPCHGSTYDRMGRVLRGPAERALERFPVDEESQGRLVIELEPGGRR